MRILIDTNVIIDALQSRKGFLEDAGWLMFKSDKYDGYITANSVTDIFYIQTRYYHNKAKAKQDITDLVKMYGILDITAIDCRNALRSDIPDFEDAILVESATREDFDYIITRNTKDFKNSPVEVATPTEFLKILGSSSGA